MLSTGENCIVPGFMVNQGKPVSEETVLILQDIHSIDTYSREGNGTLLRDSCLENPMDGGAWKAAVQRVAKSRHD